MMTKLIQWQLLRYWATAISQLRPHPAVLDLPHFFRDWRRYVSSGGCIRWRDSYPCLTDRSSHTPFDPHYFYQAAWLSRRLAKERPKKHVDIGSDIRMINVLSAFVPTEFLDNRPLFVNLSGLKCLKSSIIALRHEDQSIHSLSSLHVIEHIGLGRYGDPIDPAGSLKAAAELERVLAPRGKLYISVPVGRERVCFNAHRIFDPETVVNMFSDLHLLDYSFVNDRGEFHENVIPRESSDCEYACGMFVFIKSL